MILVNLKGRIGNAMFEIACGKYLAERIGTELYIKRGHELTFGDYYEREIYGHEFFKNFNILPFDYDVSGLKRITEVDYPTLKDIPIEDNLYLDGWFVSPYYFNYDTVKDLYVPSKELREELYDLYSPTRNSLMINVRRQDFLWPCFESIGYHSEPKAYWEAVYSFLGKKYDKVFVTSDDIKWCKNHLDFCDNIVFADKKTNSPKIFADLFLPTFVGDNAISCSTFSWWGAYLNDNPNKVVVKPFPWNTSLWLWGNLHYYNNNDIVFDICSLKPLAQDKVNNVKIALCAIAKNENLYIREWVEWYKLLGISKIFLYDNNDIDGERFEDVIGDYINEGYVEIIDVRGTPYAEVYDEDGINLQENCYYECYENLANDYDWICFFDIDEFLYLKKGWNLLSFLNQDIFNDCGTVLVGHETYGDNGLLKYESGYVTERFKKLSKNQTRFVKSIVRTKNTIENKLLLHSHHILRLKDKKVCFDNGIEFNDPHRENWIVLPEEIAKDSVCVLRHYKTKTIEEFFKRNLGRIWGKVPFDEKLTFEKCKKRFFEYNDITEEKLQYLEKLKNFLH